MKPLKQKKCKTCGVMFSPYKSTQKVCNYKCAIIYTNEQMRKQAKKKARAERREFYKQNMTLSDWKKKVQTEFNKYIRLRDVNRGCVSCGTPLQNRKFDAGHFYATTYEGIRFNETMFMVNVFLAIGIFMEIYTNTESASRTGSAKKNCNG